MELDPVFYMPKPTRNMVQTGKPGMYIFEPGNQEQYEKCTHELRFAYVRAWNAYEIQLAAGIAKEVARMCLPVAIYSTAYVTCNPRSLMSFLSLRTKHPGSKFPSFPMWEINKVADQMEELFAEKFPVTHEAFNDAGRVAP